MDVVPLVKSIVRPLSRPKTRFALIRVSLALVMVVGVFILLSKALTDDPKAQETNNLPHSPLEASADSSESNDDQMETLPSQSSKVTTYRYSIKEESLIFMTIPNVTALSAKHKRTFARLNPVIPQWGAGGQPVELETESEKKLAEKQFHDGAFNVYISDRVSPHRTLPDPRPFQCSKVAYPSGMQLGKASVILIYTNEIWSALIRTLWSVVNRTPPHLLQEIILVDDNSNKVELVDDLRIYCAYHFGQRVRIIRSLKREGLIRARLIGAHHAKGEVLVFLDSHCEVTVGWLEPLMAQIKVNRKSVVCPVIDVISDKTLEYCAGNPYFYQVGSFTWSGHFTWIDIDEETAKQYPTKPVVSPTMAGGLFAINKNYFFEVGAYDEAMEIWGGENLEMSFRIWMCGGELLISPCSHVGHIFRDYHPYSFQGKDTHGINTLRTVMVWMDQEYQKLFYMHRSDLKHAKPGDITSRLKLKRDLKCKSFRWYLENIFKGKKYIYNDKKHVTSFGFVKNSHSDLCLDVLNRNEEQVQALGVFVCSPREREQWTNQVFSMTRSGELRREENCLTVNTDTDQVQMSKCLEVELALKSRRLVARKEKRKQTWIHSEKGGRIMNQHTKDCLSAKSLKSMGDIKLEPCNKNDLYQLWNFQVYYDDPVVETSY